MKDKGLLSVKLSKIGPVFIRNVEYAGEPELVFSALAKKSEKKMDISGAVLMRRADEFGNCAGLAHMQELRKREWMIPKCLQEYPLVFPGTIRQKQNGKQEIPCLTYTASGWKEGWISISDKVSRKSMIVSFK